MPGVVQRRSKVRPLTGVLPSGCVPSKRGAPRAGVTAGRGLGGLVRAFRDGGRGAGCLEPSASLLLGFAVAAASPVVGRAVVGPGGGRGSGGWGRIDGRLGGPRRTGDLINSTLVGERPSSRKPPHLGLRISQAPQDVVVSCSGAVSTCEPRLFTLAAESSTLVRGIVHGAAWGCAPGFHRASLRTGVRFDRVPDIQSRGLCNPLLTGPDDPIPW